MADTRLTVDEARAKGIWLGESDCVHYSRVSSVVIRSCCGGTQNKARVECNLDANQRHAEPDCNRATCKGYKSKQIPVQEDPVDVYNIEKGEIEDGQAGQTVLGEGLP